MPMRRAPLLPIATAILLATWGTGCSEQEPSDGTTAPAVPGDGDGGADVDPDAWLELLGISALAHRPFEAVLQACNPD